MKKTLLSVLALAGALAMNAQNPFAYGLASEDYDATETSTFKVQYSLNADATAVKLQVLNGETVVAETACEGKTKGSHVAEIDLSSLENGEYTWQIAVTGGATSGNPLECKTLKFYHPAGVDVDNSFESPSFGTLFVAEGYTAGKTSGYVSAQANGTDGGGLYMFTPTFESIAKKDGSVRYFANNLTHNYKDVVVNTTYSGADFCKVAVAEDGRIFVARYNYQGDYILVAESVESLKNGGNFTSLVEGKTMTAEKIYNDANGQYLMGAVQSMDVKGSGEDTKILALTRSGNVTAVGESYNRVIEYSVGTGNSVSEGEVYSALDAKYTISYDKSANVAYDSRGGVWYCQYRGTPDNTNPALVYIDANGEVQYFEGKDGKARQRAAVAVSPDSKKLVVSNGKAGLLAVYDITYASDGKVSISQVSQIDISTSSNPSILAAAWDCAGNFYVNNSTNEWVKCYATARANNTFATKAASKYGFTKEGGVITEIETIKAENAPVEYYNLQGVKVENPSNGLFIKKQGNKVSKVVL